MDFVHPQQTATRLSSFLTTAVECGLLSSWRRSDFVPVKCTALTNTASFHEHKIRSQMHHTNSFERCSDLKNCAGLMYGGHTRSGLTNTTSHPNHIRTQFHFFLEHLWDRNCGQCCDGPANATMHDLRRDKHVHIFISVLNICGTEITKLLNTMMCDLWMTSLRDGSCRRCLDELLDTLTFDTQTMTDCSMNL